MSAPTPDLALAIARKVRDAGGRAVVVGGWVRDELAGRTPKDLDLEVFGVESGKLKALLQSLGRVDTVGEHFAVHKIEGIDVSLPRRESKTGRGHKGFTVEGDPALSFEDAARRRDFTINAISRDPLTSEVIDPFNGTNDLAARRLRIVDKERFADDSLRVLRALQFVARFDLTADEETRAILRAIPLDDLPSERVWGEVEKLLLVAEKPSIGFDLARDLNVVARLWPEMVPLVGCPQDPEWHPEGDVFVHTGHCCDALATLPEWREADDDTRVVLMFAVLAHDFAKPMTTHEAEKDGRKRIVSPGHEEAGGPLALQFLERINAPIATRERVVPLVSNHLAHLQNLNDRAIRRLARRLAPETIEHLCVVITADQFGRPPKPREISESVLALRAGAEHLKLAAAAPRPILMGRHLIALGLEPGAEFGRILTAAFEAQMEGEFNDLGGALEWLEGRAALGLAVSKQAFARAREEFKL